MSEEEYRIDVKWLSNGRSAALMTGWTLIIAFIFYIEGTTVGLAVFLQPL